MTFRDHRGQLSSYTAVASGTKSREFYAMIESAHLDPFLCTPMTQKPQNKIFLDKIV